MIQEVVARMEKDIQVKKIIDRARKSQKGSYPIYSEYKNQLIELGLSPIELEKASKQLVKILKV